MSSRAKQRERNQNKSQPPRIKIPKKPEVAPWKWLGLLSPTGKTAAAFALLLTVVGSYYSFTPKLVISASDTLNPQNPFATKFEIKNESLFRVSNVIFKYRPRGIFFTKGGSVSGEGFLAPDKKPIPNLESGESTSLLLQRSIDYNWNYGLRWTARAIQLEKVYCLLSLDSLYDLLFGRANYQKTNPNR